MVDAQRGAYTSQPLQPWHRHLIPPDNLAVILSEQGRNRLSVKSESKPKQQVTGNLYWLIYFLSDKEWHTATDLCEQCGMRPTDANRRRIRALAEASKGRIAGGQQGYKLVQFMDNDEYHHSRNFLLSQAREMQRRVREMDKVFYGSKGGAEMSLLKSIKLAQDRLKPRFDCAFPWHFDDVFYELPYHAQSEWTRTGLPNSILSHPLQDIKDYAYKLNIRLT